MEYKYCHDSNQIIVSQQKKTQRFRTLVSDFNIHNCHQHKALCVSRQKYLKVLSDVKIYNPNLTYSLCSKLDYENYILLTIYVNISALLCIGKYLILCLDIIYISQVILKGWLFFNGIKSRIYLNEKHVSKDNFNESNTYYFNNYSHISMHESIKYPVYTILLPMYQEAHQIPFIIKSITNIRYPKHRLDVKIIIEEDDIVMIRDLLQINLDKHFHIIIVPTSVPKTKPKAVNYAVQLALGQYVVIYDAEDIPDTDQLEICSQLFRKLDSSYVCIQCCLAFYNASENLLTKCMSIEYDIWFKFILPGLDFIGAPVSLGGTSNHIKISALEKLGYWDSYNVTEDADLGLRIYESSYKTKVISSVTLEEAPLTIAAWMYQRTRWIKGFIQTFFAYIERNKGTKGRIFSIRGMYAILFIGVGIYTNLILPFVAVYNLMYENFIYASYSALLSWATLIYCMTIYVIMKRSSVNGSRLQYFFVSAVFPLYFVLHSIASFYAIYELLVRPFWWNKTHHGVTAIVPLGK